MTLDVGVGVGGTLADVPSVPAEAQSKCLDDNRGASLRIVRKTGQTYEFGYCFDLYFSVNVKRRWKSISEAVRLGFLLPFFFFCFSHDFFHSFSLVLYFVFQSSF